MIKKISCLFFIFIGAISSSFCQSYILKWGHLELEAIKLSDYNFAISSTISETESRVLVQQSFQLLLNKEIVKDFGSIKAYYFNNQTGKALSTEIDISKGKISEIDLNTKLATFGLGDQFVFDFNTLNQKKIQFKFIIENLKKPYNVPIYVSHLRFENEFEYQLVSLAEKGKQVLKLDTTTTFGKDIMKGFLNNPKVTITHIPKFSSFNNYIKENDNSLELGKARAIELNIKKPGKKSYFSLSIEPKNYVQKVKALHWGKMKADVDSPIYSLNWAKKNADNGLVIETNGNEYSLESCRFTFYDGKNLNESYVLEYPFGNPVERFKEIVNPFSVIIDQIFLRNGPNEIIYIPQPFIFSFE